MARRVKFDDERSTAWIKWWWFLSPLYFYYIILHMHSCSISLERRLTLLFKKRWRRRISSTCICCWIGFPAALPRSAKAAVYRHTINSSSSTHTEFYFIFFYFFVGWMCSSMYYTTTCMWRVFLMPSAGDKTLSMSSSSIQLNFLQYFF